MKSSSLNFICTLALTACVFQSINVQSVDAQERMFGNGRFLKRVFGDLVPPSAAAREAIPTPAVKKGQLQAGSQNVRRPSQNAQPTLADQSIRSRHTKSRTIQPDRSETDRASVNRLPKTPATVDADSIATRSNAKATLGFGMLVELQNDKLYVAKLDPKGNAANAGIRAGDRLIAGGGIDFESLSDYNGIGDILDNGDQLEFELERRGREKEVVIVFGDAPEEQAAIAEGSILDKSTRENEPRRSMQVPRVEQVNTRVNNSFLPTKQNVEVQQPQIRSLFQRQGNTAPAPSLQLPSAAESVLN